MGRLKKSEERREQILWALFDCLAESGHERVTVKKIASQAGIPYGVIHYYFKSKDEIVSDLAGALVEMDKIDSGDDRIERFVDLLVEVLIFNPPLIRVFYNLVQMAFERKNLRKVMVKMFEDYRERIAFFLRKAGAGDVSNEGSAALLALIEGYALQWMFDPKSIEQADVRRILKKGISDLVPDRRMA